MAIHQDPEDVLHKEYDCVAHWLDTVKEAGVTALQQMESHSLVVSPYSLRGLRSLMTPKARLAVLGAMQSEKVTLNSVEAAIKQAVHEMWAEFHWQTCGDRIHPAKRVSLFSHPPASFRELMHAAAQTPPFVVHGTAAVPVLCAYAHNFWSSYLLPPQVRVQWSRRAS